MKLNQLEKEISRIRNHRHSLRKIINEYENIIIIGNGGSNAVASHIAQDYTKMLDKKAISFSDPSRLTCYINDYGRDQAYVEFLKDFADKETLVILISSSGNSMNVFNCAVHCKSLNISMLLLSGFDKNNKLNSFDGGKLKYWVDSCDYGVLETSHLVFLHSILMEDETKGIIAGAFDVIHPGYIRMFEDAKNHCGHLTVALHEDPSTERDNKLQPIQTAEERKEILLGMKNVDDVVTYKTEAQFHYYLKCGDYHVRFLGTDYMTKKYTGSDIPITIVWLDRETHEYSTTRLKKQIHKSVDDMLKITTEFD
jgi:cytidyltransferase-like protein